jgi:hypothetical protein
MEDGDVKFRSSMNMESTSNMWLLTEADILCGVAPEELGPGIFNEACFAA